MPVVVYDGKLKLVNSFDDWYVIEKSHHSNLEFFVEVDKVCSSLVCSSRISDATIEGNKEEIRSFAKAIFNRGSIEYKRCAVYYDQSNDIFFMWSPKNSQVMAAVTPDAAYGLATEITYKLGD